ncbi:MAG: MarR family winged helix-turn-helix transcriptional regulator [Clostridia bacterium]|nr:MarR family winged helix-turn-helix transcriptional regulator [Clostridia bacterium]
MPKIDSETYITIQQAVKKFENVEREVSNLTGLNVSEVEVVFYLQSAGSLSHTNICKLCNAAKAAVSRVLAKMEAKELIESYYEGSNKKTLFSKLTSKGNEIALKIKESFNYIVKDGLVGLTKEETNTFLRLLAKIVK